MQYLYTTKQLVSMLTDCSPEHATPKYLFNWIMFYHKKEENKLRIKTQYGLQHCLPNGTKFEMLDGKYIATNPDRGISCPAAVAIQPKGCPEWFFIMLPCCRFDDATGEVIVIDSNDTSSLPSAMESCLTCYETIVPYFLARTMGLDKNTVNEKVSNMKVRLPGSDLRIMLDYLKYILLPTKDPERIQLTLGIQWHDRTVQDTLVDELNRLLAPKYFEVRAPLSEDQLPTELKKPLYTKEIAIGIHAAVLQVDEDFMHMFYRSNLHRDCYTHVASYKRN